MPAGVAGGGDNGRSPGAEVFVQACAAQSRWVYCRLRRRYVGRLTSDDLDDLIQLSYLTIWRRLTRRAALPPPPDQVARRYLVVTADRHARRLLQCGRMSRPHVPLCPSVLAIEDRPPDIVAEELPAVGLLLRATCRLTHREEIVIRLLFAGVAADVIPGKARMTPLNFEQLRRRAVKRVRATIARDDRLRNRVAMLLG